MREKILHDSDDFAGGGSSVCARSVGVEVRSGRGPAHIGLEMVNFRT